ncbi:MAG: sugar ABC transporter permease YjfF [Verrucomicrobia bacterium]|nr:sugar ABC transporter permease YjfF [Verrucomicrobiota bacterium]MBI3869763.1 sugar ABC transporter permease YjfF [Verrucomicrobiota bacterium]
MKAPRSLPLLATSFVFVTLYGVASALYPGFLSLQVFVNLFGDNAFLGVAALGMTLVILAGGIDLSVGAVVAFSTVFIATLVARGAHPLGAMAAAVTAATFFGAFMGWLIQAFEVPAFLVTLGGAFFARGMAFVVNRESVAIAHPFWQKAADFGIPLSPSATLPATALTFLITLGAMMIIAHRTRFGRNVYAVGGGIASARLMGLPVASTRIAVYALSGACSGLAGVVSTLYTGSGDPARAAGLELDAIASVVIGGTLLTGGVGSPAGTLMGVLIFGTIQSALVFDGRLNSWWLRIAMGGLLLLFVLFQRALSRGSALEK